MTHGSAAPHGNVQNARQSSKHGKGAGRTAKKVRTAEKVRRTAKKKTHGKGRCRAVLEKRTAKNSLPGSTLPCSRCRASTHGKGFAVRFPPFAVRFARTAKNCSPVVLAGVIVVLCSQREELCAYVAQFTSRISTTKIPSFPCPDLLNFRGVLF
jgi:hypothetical protein